MKVAAVLFTAFAKAAQAFDEPRYLEAARRTALALEKDLYDGEKKELWRRWREGRARGA